MHEHAVFGAQIAADLTRGLQERLGFDIADGATDFGDDHVDVIGRLRTHADLISLVMCGMTCTHCPRYSPARSLRSTSW